MVDWLGSSSRLAGPRCGSVMTLTVLDLEESSSISTSNVFSTWSSEVAESDVGSQPCRPRRRSSISTRMGHRLGQLGVSGSPCRHARTLAPGLSRSRQGLCRSRVDHGLAWCCRAASLRHGSGNGVWHLSISMRP